MVIRWSGKGTFLFLGISLLFLLLLYSRLWDIPAISAHAAYKRVSAVSMAQSATPRQPAPDPPPQVNSQFLQPPSNNSTIIVSRGSNQGNSGNQGENDGFNQDSSANSGNAISSQHKHIGLQENNQLIQNNGNSGGGETDITNIGLDQGNSGNEGENNGFNQDNAQNSGNQVNNQGTVIGTQINNQGSEVNNNGSTIQHQVNYVSLLPNIQLHISLQPRPQISLNVH